MVLAGALAASGCYARARVEPAYVETTYVPAHIHTYPSYRYDGRVVYLIDNHWYFRHPTGSWVYYREEPPVLYRQRMSIRQAPPAPRRVAPRDPYRAPPYRQAPPAYYRDDRHDGPPPPTRRKRHDDRDDRDDDDRDRDGRRNDHREDDHHDRDRY